MYLSTITLKNFRKYAYDGANKHGITVNFHKGLNALIGENDSGKSAIIDAIKLVLQTQSGEFTRVMDEDFYISATGEIATEFSIDCIFEGFEINEAKNFVEWLSFEKDKTSGAVFYKLFLTGHGVKMVVFILNLKLEMSKTVYHSMVKRENS